MNPNFRIYAFMLLSLGILSALIYAAFENSIRVMYAEDGGYFLAFFYGFILLGFLLSLVVRFRSARSPLDSLYYLVFFTLSISCLYTGLTYSYDLKTDEFLLYFLSVCGSVFFFVIGFCLLLRFIAWNTGLKAPDKWRLVCYGIAGVATGSLWNFLVRTTESLEIIHSWYLATLLILFMFYISRKEKPFLSVE